MAEKQNLSNVGLREIGLDDNENVEEINELTRAEIFSKCYSRDGNTTNPNVVDALEKMQQLKSQLPSSDRDEGPDDIFAQVLGHDKGGRVRMFGVGATTKMIYGGDSTGHNDIHAVTKENEKLEKELRAKNMIIQRLMRNNDLGGQSNIMNISTPPTSRNSGLRKSDLPSAHVQSPEHDISFTPNKPARPPLKSGRMKSSRPLAPVQSNNAHDQSFAPLKSVALSSAAAKSIRTSAPVQSTASVQSNPPPQYAPHTSVNSYNFEVGAKVILTGIISRDFVAKGIVESLCPSKLVGYEELGPNWCEVKVNVAIKSDEGLIRTIGNIKKLGQAIGRSIAWPKLMVQPEEFNKRNA